MMMTMISVLILMISSLTLTRVIVEVKCGAVDMSEQEESSESLMTWLLKYIKIKDTCVNVAGIYSKAIM